VGGVPKLFPIKPVFNFFRSKAALKTPMGAANHVNGGWLLTRCSFSLVEKMHGDLLYFTKIQVQKVPKNSDLFFNLIFF
jgi:hypothetical protein